MRAEAVNPYPLDSYDRIFRHQVIFQPNEGPLLQVASGSDLAEIAASVDSGLGRLYSLYWGMGIRHVTDMARLREFFRIPGPKGWKNAVATIEREVQESKRSPKPYEIENRYRTLLTREWRKEHNFTVENELEENPFDSSFSLDDFDWEDVPPFLPLGTSKEQ